MVEFKLSIDGGLEGKAIIIRQESTFSSLICWRRKDIPVSGRKECYNVWRNNQEWKVG